MSLGEVFFIGWSLLMAIITVVFIVWAWESGQLKNVEKAKYNMLQEKEPQPWPGRQEISNDQVQAEDETEANGGKI